MRPRGVCPVMPLGVLIALLVLALVVAIAKAAQYGAVATFGDVQGFEFASFMGAGPVIALYFLVAVRYPKLNRYGLTRG